MAILSTGKIIADSINPLELMNRFGGNVTCIYTEGGGGGSLFGQALPPRLGWKRYPDHFSQHPVRQPRRGQINSSSLNQNVPRLKCMNQSKISCQQAFQNPLVLNQMKTYQLFVATSLWFLTFCEVKRNDARAHTHAHPPTHTYTPARARLCRLKIYV